MTSKIQFIFIIKELNSVYSVSVSLLTYLKTLLVPQAMQSRIAE